MAALACDFVWAHEDIVLNPHYKTMGLHGSEYWTYFLPRRVGDQVARELTDKCMPVSAKAARDNGMIDELLSPNRHGFMNEVLKRSSMFVEDSDFYNAIVSGKSNARTAEWHDMVQRSRDHELKIMRCNFGNNEYIGARKSFVYKTNPTATPLHLVQSLYRPDAITPVHPPATTMSGTKVAKMIKNDLAAKVAKAKEAANGEVPGLAVVMVSGNEDSEKYVGRKVKAAKKVGIQSETHCFDPVDKDLAVLEEQLVDLVKSLNEDTSVNGIIVQLPLPSGIDHSRVLGTVDPTKDVDGFMATSMGGLAGGVCHNESDTPRFVPCTARGIMALLDYYSIPLVGKKVCVIGRSRIVGMPTSLLLMQRGATVTNCDINTTGLQDCLRNADIVIAAAGSPELVKADWIKPGAVVVDVGMNVITSCDEDGSENEKILGDVEAEAKFVASLMTPVPGGVGPMTVAMLMQNTVEAFMAQVTTIQSKRLAREKKVA
jgi:5,10-methylene-tetrahydrofolate dehydrogenase/methenyl tetrahydrofolate cyclohydrolase